MSKFSITRFNNPRTVAQRFPDNQPEVLSFDSNITMGLMLENTPSGDTDPLDALIQIEEWLLEEHGMTFMQAVRAGVNTTR